MAKLDPMAALAFLFAAMAILSDAAGIDRWFASIVFDEAAGAFPLRHSWLLETVMHNWARRTVIAIAVVVMATLCWDFFRPGPSTRRQLLVFIITSMVAATLTISVIKYLSVPHCPYNLVEFGGNASSERGRCWPSGHASVGFCLAAFLVALRYWRSRFSPIALLGFVSAGVALTVSQSIRGAHFLSHGLWTGAIVCLVNYLLAEAMLNRDAKETA